MKLFRGEEAFRILVVAVMMVTLAAAVAELAHRAIPAFDPTLLVTLAFLVCLEGIATDRLARQLPEAGLRMRLHGVEWIVIIFLLRLVLPLSQGLDSLAAAVPRWLASPASLVDGGLVAGAALLFVTWALGIRMSRALEALGPEADAPPPKDSAAYYAWLTRPRVDERGEGWQTLLRLFFGGGALLLLCSGLARLDLQAALTLRNPAIAGIVGNALVYFGLGFMLLAQGHYAVLRAGWQRNGVGVSDSLARRWIVLGVGFAAGVALLVLLLPTRPSLALFGAVFELLWLAFYYLASIVLALFAGLAYLLALLGSLFGMGPQAGESAPEMAPPRLEPQPPAQRVAWWEAIQGFVLWAVIVAAVIYALVRFVRERRDLWQQLAGTRGPLGWIVGLVAAVWRWLGGVGRHVATGWRALVSRMSRPAAAVLARRRSGWPHPRTIRERVRLLYLVALRHAAQEGQSRRPGDTPYEYAGRLSPLLTEGRDELETLTQAFVAARYSQREFAAAEVGPLQAALRRLRQAWRRLADRRPASDHGQTPAGP